MAGRIRSIKPEILDDERVAALSDAAFRLFVGAIVLADDYGNFGSREAHLCRRVWWGRQEVTTGLVSVALVELETSGLIQRYVVRGQAYAHVTGWEKHQRMGNAGRAVVPGPDEADDHFHELNDFNRPRGSQTSPLAGIPSPLSHSSSLPDSGSRGRVRERKLDQGELGLSASALRVRDAIVADSSLRPIVARPNALAEDLVKLGPGIDVAAEVHAAGAWLRANPKKPKTNGAQFLNGWIKRTQKDYLANSAKPSGVQRGGYDITKTNHPLPDISSADGSEF